MTLPLIHTPLPPRSSKPPEGRTAPPSPPSSTVPSGVPPLGDQLASMSQLLSADPEALQSQEKRITEIIAQLQKLRDSIRQHQPQEPQHEKVTYPIPWSSSPFFPLLVSPLTLGKEDRLFFLCFSFSMRFFKIVIIVYLLCTFSCAAFFSISRRKTRPVFYNLEKNLFSMYSRFSLVFPFLSSSSPSHLPPPSPLHPRSTRKKEGSGERGRKVEGSSK